MSKVNLLALITAFVVSLGLFGGLAVAQDTDDDTPTPTPTEEPEQPPEAGFGGSQR
ncbi:MAG: hypothetical protein ACOX6N_05000 [Patescibacteria group bacterium]|jgi:hypothetical protein